MNPSTYQSFSDAAKRGYCARLEEMPKESNPFQYGPGFAGEESRNHASWIFGWEAADSE